MRGLEVSLGFSPEMLSRFTMVEELSAVAFIPVWGLLCDLFEMKYILMLAVFLSGLLPIVLSTISNFGLMLAVRVINGATIGSVTPSTQIYVVRMMNVGLGIAFGILYSVASVARLVCSLIVTKLSPKVFSGIYGWRICARAYGISCILLSPLLVNAKLQSEGIQGHFWRKYFH